jgi:hypothetical protein
MDRLTQLLLTFVVVCLVGIGIEVAVIGSRAHQDAERQACLDKVQATALTALLVPSEAVDEQGRLDSARQLGERLDAC